MKPKIFLTIGGVVLVIIGLLGIARLLGRISSASLFNPPYWINFFHLGLGIIVLVAVWSRKNKLQSGFTLFAAIIGITIGLLGLIFGSRTASRYNNPQLADPSDHLAHLTVGLLALWAYLKRKPISK